MFLPRFLNSHRVSTSFLATHVWFLHNLKVPKYMFVNWLHPNYLIWMWENIASEAPHRICWVQGIEICSLRFLSILPHCQIYDNCQKTLLPLFIISILVLFKILFLVPCLTFSMDHFTHFYAINYDCKMERHFSIFTTWLKKLLLLWL